MNNQFAREQIFSSFMNNLAFCQTEDGEKIRDCETLKQSMVKELSGGCSSCKKAGIYSKYRQIIFARIIESEDAK